MTNEAQTFQIAKPGKGVTVFIIGLILFTLIPVVSVAYTACDDNSMGAAITCGVLVFLVDALMVWFGWSAHNIKYVIDKEGISITGCLYGRKISRSSIFAKGFTITDLKSQSTYRPGMRTNGIGMPGFMAGWFCLKNKQRGLLFVTDRSKVVCIPTQEYMLLVSVENPVEFLDALKKTWNIEQGI
jgi:hypothetical protein